MPTLIARHRDHILDAGDRGDTASSYEGGLLLLDDGTSHLMLDDGSSKLTVKSGSVIESPVLYAPHRDYILLAEEKE